MASEMSERYFDFLIDKVREPQFPSTQMLNRLEATLEDQDQLQEYLDVLFEKVQEVQYPSTDMLNRIQRLLPLTR